jgi:hypothetical protein
MQLNRAFLTFRSDLDLDAGYMPDQPPNAAAAISATPQIASVIHIVVTFNFRFRAHNGLKSDSEPCPKRAICGHSFHAWACLIPSQ